MISKMSPDSKYKIHLYFHLILYSVTVQSSAVNFSRLNYIEKSLHQLYYFENLIILSNSNYHTEQHDQFIKSIQTDIRTTTLTVTEASINQTYSFYQLLNHHRTLSILFLGHEQDKMLLTLDHLLTKMHFSKLLIVLTINSSWDDIQAVCKWCWNLKFLNVIVIHQADIFSYTPFPKFRMIKLTQANPAEYFYDKLANLQGYRIRIPAKHDGSRVFTYLNRKNENVISGFSAKIILNYIEITNGSLEIYNTSYSSTVMNLTDELMLLATSKIDLTFTCHGSHNTKALVKHSFPLLLTPWFVMVPASSEIQAYRYIMLPFSFGVWTCIAVYVIYLTVLDYSISKYTTADPISLGQAITNSISVTLFIAPVIPLQLNWKSACSGSQKFLFGFIITQLYLAFLTSFLATKLYEPQMNTAEDMIHSKLKIMVLKHEMKTALRFTKEYPTEFDNLFVPTENKELFVKYRSTFNKSFGYTVTMDRWNFLKTQQALSNFPLFRQPTDQVFLFTTLCIPFHQDSPFFKAINSFIIRTKETGLQIKWEQGSNREAFDAGILFKIVDYAESKPVMDSNKLGLVCLMLFNRTFIRSRI